MVTDYSFPIKCFWSWLRNSRFESLNYDLLFSTDLRDPNSLAYDELYWRHSLRLQCSVYRSRYLRTIGPSSTLKPVISPSMEELSLSSCSCSLFLFSLCSDLERFFRIRLFMVSSSDSLQVTNPDS